MSFSMLVGLLGGLGLFIYGMRQMSEGLQKSAGKKLRHFLAKLTSKPIAGVMVGAGVTAIIQSSSATTVMVVGFVNAGLMTLAQSIGVIMGANIGTTVTAQLVSFELGDYAYHAIALGGFTYLFSRKKNFQYIGQVLLGFGILFLGLNTMSETMRPLRDSQYFVQLMERFGQYPLLGVLIGMAVTVIIQSSSATFGILVGLVSVGVIDFRAGVPILLGSNIGTTVTAILSGIGANVNARKSAAAHFIFNILGSGLVILLLYLIPGFIGGLQSLLQGTAHIFGKDPSAERMLANTHTLFNVTNTLIWLPFVGFMIKLVNWIISGEEVEIKRGLVYLDERMLKTPTVAVEQVKNELVRMHEIASEMVKESQKALLERDRDAIKKIRKREDIIDEIEEELLVFLTRIPQASLSELDIRTIDMYFGIIDDIESIADNADSLVNLTEGIEEENLSFSENARESLNRAFELIYDLLDKSITLLEEEDLDLTSAILEGEEEMDQLELKYREQHKQRLNQGTCVPSAGIIYLEALEDIENISDQTADIAQGFLER